MSNLVSYSADNAAVNYGKFHSVFTNLRKINSNIIKANCNCHVLHNAAKHALHDMPYDVESLVIKVYNEFSSSAKNIEKLKECYDFVDNEYSKLLKHVPTRFLTLFRALDRLIKNWQAVKTYFLSKEKVSKVIMTFIKDQINELHNSENLTIKECYIYFAHNFMRQFHNTILKLESGSIHSVDVYGIMNVLRENLKMRISDAFFGMEVSNALQYLLPNETLHFKENALNVYKQSLEYLEKWFDYENSCFKFFMPLNLSEDITIESIIKVAKVVDVKIDNNSGDLLYNEVSKLRNCLSKLNEEKLPIDKKWVKFFSSNNCPILLKIVSKVFSIPISNAFVERLFSIMKKACKDDRNRMSTSIIKAEICTKINYNLSCSEFYDFVMNNKPLLEAAKSEKNTISNQNN